MSLTVPSHRVQLDSRDLGTFPPQSIRSSLLTAIPQASAGETYKRASAVHHTRPADRRLSIQISPHSRTQFEQGIDSSPASPRLASTSDLFYVTIATDLSSFQGSFLEFIELTKILKKSGRYSIVVPSLPGFGFSDAPPLDKKTGVLETSDLLHQLMLGLGYSKYSIQVRPCNFRSRVPD